MHRWVRFVWHVEFLVKLGLNWSSFCWTVWRTQTNRPMSVWNICRWSKKIGLTNQSQRYSYVQRQFEWESNDDWFWASKELAEYMTGRTPLHIACSKNDIYSAEIVQLLIDHNANPNLICNGFSPLSLAIASGNKEAVDILLKSGFCDLSLPLTNGVGSALSVICSTLYEPNWPVHERLRLVRFFSWIPKQQYA